MAEEQKLQQHVAEEYSKPIQEMVDILTDEQKEEEKYLYRIFVEDTNLKASDYDTNEYFVALEECDSISSCNRSIIPSAIENLSRFLGTWNNHLALWKQTDIPTAEGSAIEILRDVHDNLEQEAEGGAIADQLTMFQTQEEWKEYLTDMLGDAEVVFLKRRPIITQLLHWSWTWEQLLRVLFGNGYRFVSVDPDSGLVGEADPLVLQGDGLHIVVTLWEKK